MKKLLLTVFYLPIIVFGQINVGVDQTICLGDTAQIIATFPPWVSVSWTGSPILITECDPGNPDWLEIQNVSAIPVDVTGWRVIISNSYTLINTANPIEQILSGIMSTGDTRFWTDQAGNIDYWGNNMLWNPGVYPSFTTWIMLLDDNNNVMDVFVGKWLVADIASSAILTTVGTISLSGHWNGDGIDQTTITATSGISWSRFGSDDHDDATDFSVNPTSAGTTNIGLNLPFAGGGATWYDVNTGQMVGNGDTLYYSPTQSTDIVGQIIDTSGQLWTDTMHLEVLNTAISTSGFSLCNGLLVLTAQSGFSSYYWNGASTSQVLTVNTPGSYFVICTTANGQTCQSPPITIYQDTISIALSTPDSLFVCQGDTVIIDGPLGFSQYNWSTGDITSSITTNAIGNYSLTVTDGNGCTGVSNTTTIDISPQTITATTTGYSLCNGPVTLNNPVPATIDRVLEIAVHPVGYTTSQ